MFQFLYFQIMCAPNVVCVLMASKSAYSWVSVQRIEAVCVCVMFFPPLPSSVVSGIGFTIVIKTWCFSFTVDFTCLFRPWVSHFFHYLTVISISDVSIGKIDADEF